MRERRKVFLPDGREVLAICDDEFLCQHKNCNRRITYPKKYCDEHNKHFTLFEPKNERSFDA